MTNKQKAEEITLKIFENGHFTHNAISQRKEIEKSLLEMAQWKKQEMIKKACEWWENELTYPTMSQVEIDWYQTKIVAFKKAMEG